MLKLHHFFSRILSPELLSLILLTVLMFSTGLSSAVLAADKIAMAKTVTPNAKADHRGWVDVWTLRLDISALSTMPKGEQECAYEGDGEEDVPHFKTKKERLAYQRQREKAAREDERVRQQCERAEQVKKSKYEAALSLVNSRWMPLLRTAIQAGDPVAEVILRLCETAPMLDRAELASDCSENIEKQAEAKKRLEAIGFQPALHRYTMTDDGAFSQYFDKICRSKPAAQQAECDAQNRVQRYTRILSILKTGFLAVAEGHNTCHAADVTPVLDALAEECQRQMWLMMGIPTRVQRFYTAGLLDEAPDGVFELTLARPVLKGMPAKLSRDWPFASRGSLTRNNHNAFSDPQFQQKFYAELDRFTAQVEANISADLQKEPRWAVFLIERTNGKLYDVMDRQSERPSASEVEEFDAKSPRSAALKIEHEIERLKTLSYPDLIQTLYTSRNVKLYYSWLQFPLNLKEIERRAPDLQALVRSYRAEHADALFRFNIIMILNKKWNASLPIEDLALFRACMIEALNDVDAQTVAEAASELKIFGEMAEDPTIKVLIAKGRKEAQDWLRKERDR